jgi:SsrA-binding protein
MKILNRKAHFDYELSERFEAGINLYGFEVKAVKLGHADLSGSFVKIIGSEAYIVNSKIFPYKYAATEGYDEGRTRKLLLHKKQILTLKNKTDAEGLAIVPTAMYTNDNGFVKVEVALGKGKKKWDKREAIKKREIRKSLDNVV